MPTLTPSPPALLAGRFRLDHKIGSGGMATVWSATDLKIGRVVAVKLMSLALATDLRLRRRFLAEAVSLAKIVSPHVVSVHDFDFAGPAPFLAMERLDGQDLGQLCRANRRLGVRDALDIVRQAGAGLLAAHRAGVIHRDVKLSNIFVCDTAIEAPLVKLLDFGVAKTVGETSSVTAIDTFVGSLAYSSPEHVRCEPASPSFDLWGLAVVAFRLLTGVAPFRGSLCDVLRAIALADYPSPTSIASDLPRACEDFFAKALAKEQKDRFQTIGELVDALERALLLASGSHARPLDPRWCEALAEAEGVSAEGCASLYDTFVDEPTSHSSQTMHVGPAWARLQSATPQSPAAQNPSSKERMS